jgi:hypothetical protein
MKNSVSQGVPMIPRVEVPAKGNADAGDFEINLNSAVKMNHKKHKKHRMSSLPNFISNNVA